MPNHNNDDEDKNISLKEKQNTKRAVSYSINPKVEELSTPTNVNIELIDAVDGMTPKDVMTTLKKKPVIGSEVFFKQLSCSGECLICMEIKEVAFVIAPCGHDGICQDCLKDI